MKEKFEEKDERYEEIERLEKMRGRYGERKNEINSEIRSLILYARGT